MVSIRTLKPTTLRLTLLALVVLLQLTSLVGVSAISRSQMEQQSHEEARLSLKSEADEIVEKTQLFLVPALSQIILAEQLIADGMLDPNMDQLLSAFFQSQLRANHWLKSMYLGREDGSFVRVGRLLDSSGPNNTMAWSKLDTKIVAISDEGQREVSSLLTDDQTGESILRSDHLDDYDPRERDWYLKATESQSVVWTDALRYSMPQRPAISSSVLVRTPDGNKAGVLGLSIDIKALSGFLGSSKDTSVVLVDADGSIVAHSTGELATSMVDSPADEISSIVSLNNPESAFINNLYENILAAVGKGDDATNFEYGVVDNERYLGLSRNVYLLGGAVNWTLLMTHPEAALAGSVHREILSSGLLLAMAIIAAPGLLALLVIAVITAPIYRLYRRATVDKLTKALNREEFENKMSALISRHAINPRKQQLVAVAIDLDGFKLINDSFGHPAGDAILTTAVQRIRDHLRDGDIVGRMGGDEFAIACFINQSEDALAYIERLRQIVVSTPVNTPSGNHSFGMTMGVTVCHGNDTTNDMLTRADAYLIRGKSLRKNRSYRFERLRRSSPPQILEPSAVCSI